MLFGTVKKFFDAKGYGFITPDSGDADVFVHISDVGLNSLTAGDRVSYDVATSPKGFRATNLKIVGT